MSNNRRKTRVSINSKHLNSGGSSVDFTIPIDGIHDVYQIEILNLSIPNTLYNVNSLNNKIYWIDTNGASIISTITAGNYTSAEILTSLKTVLDADTTGVETYTVAIGDNTEKITITPSAGTCGLEFGANTSNSMASLLGFEDVDVAVGSSLTADNVYDLSYTHNIYIESDLASKFDDRTVNTTQNYRPILSIVNRDTSFGSLLHESPNTRVSYRANIGQIRSINMRLKDDLNNPLGGDTGLNGRHWSCDLLIHHLIN